MTEPADNPQPTAPGDAPAQPPAAVHPSVHVRLADALAHVENFFARHPELEGALKTELSSGIMALERLI